MTVARSVWQPHDCHRISELQATARLINSENIRQYLGYDRFVQRTMVSLHPPLSPTICPCPYIFFCQSMVIHTASYSIHLSLVPLFVAVPSGSHSMIFRDNLCPGVLFACRNHRNRFPSVTRNKSFFTSILTLIVSPFSLICLRIFSKNTSQLPIADEPLVSVFLRC